MNEHAHASELLPWMVNGRIEATEARWLNDHLEHCDACRSELVAQRRIRNALTREPTVEFAPQASFNRLWKRIEAEAAGITPQAPNAAAEPRSAPPLVAPIRGGVRPWVRVTLAAQAAAILVLCGVLWLRPDPVAYRTVTDAAPGPSASGTVIKAIFSDQVRLADVKEILAGAGLVVVSGPSEAGVYALVPRDARAQSQVPAAVARLHADPRVRFAEVGAQ
jgi:anti-sigma factor RsiW